MQTFSCKDGAEVLSQYLEFGGEFLAGRIKHLTELGEDFNVYKSTFDVNNVDADIMKQVIGKDGYYFKLTTENNSLDFIWHDMSKKSVDFWGPNKKDISRAISIIKSRIYNKQNTESVD